jgi:Tfp pilus assembly protein PilF
MGNEFLRRRRIVLAESIFTEATSYSPTYVAALLGLARTYSYSGQDEKAMEHYDKLLGVDPDNAAAQRELIPLLTRRSARSRH